MPPSTTSSKYFLRELSLIRLYTVLLLSFSYFLLQMIVAHIAHSLILQVGAYQMLYNMLCLLTSVITAKMCRNGSNLKNTFGWTRIDVTGAVASLCFLAATCFSVCIECLQAMLHASHHETMKMPIHVLIVGLIGFAVNFAACVVIGGHTNHQKSFLGSHRDGHDIVISPSARRGPNPSTVKCGSPVDVLRDFFGCILVVIVSLMVYFLGDDRRIDFVDPALTILQVLILAITSIKYAKDAVKILLLTIPDNINVSVLLEELFVSFPEIVNFHEFHIWQLNSSRIIATAHVVLRDTENCWVVQNNIIEFLQDKGITQVTLQPEFLEFHTNENSEELSPEILKTKQCFLPCKEEEECNEKKCCLTEEELLKIAANQHHGHSHGGGGGSHSHGGAGHSHGQKSTWSWSKLLKNKSLENVEKEDEENKKFPVSHPFQVNKSTPELTHVLSCHNNKLEEVQVEPHQVSVKLSSCKDHHEEDSTDDEDKEVLKPMI